MKKAIYTLTLILAGLAVLIVVSSTVIGREPILISLLGPVERTETDFANLRPSDKPNRYLVCPAGYCGAPPDRTSPVFDVSLDVLRGRWESMIDRQPRLARLPTTSDGLQSDYVQRSLLVGFPDTITVRFIPLGPDRTTLAVFSRSHYGRSDFGVNRKRVNRWLTLLGDPG